MSYELPEADLASPTHGLNPQQAEAAMHVDGPLVIFAGAGSGKTASVTHRCANLLRSGVPAHEILLVTFTNKAANEMKERMARMVGRDLLRGLWAGTFHSVAARFLRTYAHEVDRRQDFVIYDDRHQETVVRQIVDELGLDKKVFGSKLLVERIQLAKQDAKTPDGVLEGDPSPDEIQFADIWRRYENWLRSSNAMDFEDLILFGMRLAESDTDTGRALRSRFRYVTVDEFQDTNTTQYRMVKALATNRNFCVVGDDDQCIYTWRGAKVENIRSFTTEFPDAKVVKLEQNYRSTKNVVGAALAVIAQSKDRVPKELWTANEDGARVAFIKCPDDRLEAKFVAERVKKLMNGQNSLEDVAVLYRTHAQSRVIEDALRMWSIPYRIIGGHGFYDRKEIRDLMSYLRLIVNCDSDVDLLRVINEPARGVGAGTVGRLRDVATSMKVSLWSALPYARKTPEIRPREREGIGRFTDMMNVLMLDAMGMRPSEVALKAIFETGYKVSLQMEAKELKALGRNKEAEEEEERAANCDELVEAIAYYERTTLDSGEIPTLRGYLEMVALMLEKDKEKADERLTLMTVHASKGLEFAHLFLVGVEDGHFPGRDAALEDIEEARRLVYVGMTRARRQLWMTHCEQRMRYTEIIECSPSRFLFDMSKAGRPVLIPSLVGLTLSKYEDLERQALDASAR